VSEATLSTAPVDRDAHRIHGTSRTTLPTNWRNLTVAAPRRV